MNSITLQSLGFLCFIYFTEAMEFLTIEEFKLRFEEDFGNQKAVLNDSNEIGYGTYGKVFKIPYKNDKTKFVAVKQFKSDQQMAAVSEMNSIKKLEEANILSIPKYHYCCSKSGYYFIVMEYFPYSLKIFQNGQNAENYPKIELEQTFKCLENHKKLKLISKIFYAISSFHEKGFVHFDIKPENILLSEIIKDSLPEVRLVDFGTVLCEKDKYFKSASPTYADFETLTRIYERKGGWINDDWKADTYAGGVLIFEMLATSVEFDECSKIKYSADEKEKRQEALDSFNSCILSKELMTDKNLPKEKQSEFQIAFKSLMTDMLNAREKKTFTSLNLAKKFEGLAYYLCKLSLDCPSEIEKTEATEESLLITNGDTNDMKDAQKEFEVEKQIDLKI